MTVNKNTAAILFKQKNRGHSQCSALNLGLAVGGSIKTQSRTGVQHK